MKEERYNEFFKKIKKDYKDLIPYIIEYYKYIKTMEGKKIRGKNKDNIISELRIKIKVYFKIEIE